MQIAQALGKIGSDELREEINDVGMEIGRVFYLSAEDILVYFDGRAAVPERSEATEHLKDQNAQRPPVH